MCHCPPGDRASVRRNPAGTCQHPTLTPMLLAAGGHSEGLSRCAPDNPSARHGTETEWPPSPAHAADLEAAPVPWAAAPAHRPGRATGPTPSQQSPWSSLLCPRGTGVWPGRGQEAARRPTPLSMLGHTCTHIIHMHTHAPHALMQTDAHISDWRSQTHRHKRMRGTHVDVRGLAPPPPHRRRSRWAAGFEPRLSEQPGAPFRARPLSGPCDSRAQ